MVDVTPLPPKRKPAVKFPRGFDVGAIVKLKSGGTVMTITHQMQGAPFEVRCVWQDTAFVSQSENFPVACLRLAQESEVESVDDEAAE